MKVEYEIVKRYYVQRHGVIAYDYHVITKTKCCDDAEKMEVVAVLPTEYGDSYHMGEVSAYPNELALMFYREFYHDDYMDEIFIGPLNFCPFCGAKNELVKVGDKDVYEKVRKVKQLRQVPIVTHKDEEVEVEETYWEEIPHDDAT